ncbi:MAG: response regulator [Pyrinomonadaceae bacterium]
MRLEFEPSVTTLPLVDNAASDDFSSSTTYDLDSLLKKGVAAAQKGERDNARKLLSQASAIDPECEDAWMWLASISEYPEELLAFLDRVLSINPENGRALEWRVATRSLLAKTFVQRAEAAYRDKSLDLAAKCVEHALAHDDKTDGAWFIRALMTEAEDKQLEYLERVLELNPQHGDAKKAVKVIFDARSQAAFNEAKEAAVSGDHERSIEILDAFLKDVPDSVDAWVLKSHLSQGLDEKVAALEKALEVDPKNAAARSGLAFLALTFGASRSEEDAKPTETACEEPQTVSELEMAPEFGPEADMHVAAEITEAEEVVAEARMEEQNDHVHFDTAVEDLSTSDQPDVDSLDAFADSDHSDSTDEELDSGGPRSLEELFGPVAPMAEADDQTVESLSFEDGAIIEQPADESVKFHLEETDESPKEESSYADFAPVPSPFDTKVDHRFSCNECPYCDSANDHQAFECASCHSSLTLSDLEGLFANNRADRDAVLRAVARMEAERDQRDLTASEMTDLGLGYFNLGNSDAALKNLQDAARLDPNNVILGGQVNAIAIRIDEMRRQNELHQPKSIGKTILVVDDSPTVRKLISGKLEKSGHVVVCASDGVEALEQLESGLPDLVLLDITMPRMDGYEVCKQIRSNPRARDLPVVMISGKDGFFDKVRGRMAGSTGYVTKPFGPETLMKALETYLLPEA